MNIAKKNITYVHQNNDESDEKPRNLLVNIKNIVKQQKNSLYSPFTSKQQICNRFKKKAELFNLFFAKQCPIIDNSSELPSNFLKKTDKTISAITFTCDDTATLIKNLDPNKAHGHDMISIRMLKLCGKSICKPLDLIFQSCIEWRME